MTTGESTPSPEATEEHVIIKIRLLDDQIASIKTHLMDPMENILLNLCHKRNVDFDLYTLELVGGMPIKLDQPFKHYYSNANDPLDIRLVKGAKVYCTIAILENEEEVLLVEYRFGK